MEMYEKDQGSHVVEKLLPGNFILGAWVETRNPEYLAILDEEKEKAGLHDTDISLFVPDPPEYGYTRCFLNGESIYGEAFKWNDKAYGINLIPVPEAREITGHSIRETIRHELAHIKYGNCDIRLPKFLHVLHSKFISEPRARRYAKKE